MLVIKNSKVRNILRIAVPYVLIPGVIIFGIFVIGEKRYAYISAAVSILSLLLFFTGFERKKVGARKLTAVAVMVALSVAGRFIPFFKPITAITVITSIYLGGEAGFLVGSMSALLSNFYFGQGPWTPYQMFAWGMIGLIAGYLSGPLKRHKPLLLLYGVLTGVLYSFIMDTWTVYWYNGSVDWNLYLMALYTAIPYTILYVVSNVVFLAILAKPFGEKLERVKLKYGI